MPVPQGKHKELDELAQRHQQAAQLYKNPKFRKALDDIQDNTADRNNAKANPNSYFHGKGVDIPEGAELRVEEGSIRIGCCWGDWCFWFEW